LYARRDVDDSSTFSLVATASAVNHKCCMESPTNKKPRSVPLISTLPALRFPPHSEHLRDSCMADDYQWPATGVAPHDLAANGSASSNASVRRCAVRSIVSSNLGAFELLTSMAHVLVSISFCAGTRRGFASNRDPLRIDAPAAVYQAQFHEHQRVVGVDCHRRAVAVYGSREHCKQPALVFTPQ
jgi:hypothetical protein